MLTFFVPGIPAPQGSKKAFLGKSGRINLVESSAKVEPWRTVVALIARNQAQAQGWSSTTAAVSVQIVFSLPRPKSLPNSVVDHVKNPDVDKLIRSTLDGLSDAGVVWRDDSQVKSVLGVKKYAKPGFSGALIAISLK